MCYLSKAAKKETKNRKRKLTPQGVSEHAYYVRLLVMNVKLFLLLPKPQRKKKGRGRALAIQSKADLFKRCRLFMGMARLDYFVLSTG